MSSSKKKPKKKKRQRKNSESVEARSSLPAINLSRQAKKAHLAKQAEIRRKRKATKISSLPNTTAEISSSDSDDSFEKRMKRGNPTNQDLERYKKENPPPPLSNSSKRQKMEDSTFSTLAEVSIDGEEEESSFELASSQVVPIDLEQPDEVLEDLSPIDFNVKEEEIDEEEWNRLIEKLSYESPPEVIPELEQFPNQLRQFILSEKEKKAYEKKHKAKFKNRSLDLEEIPIVKGSRKKNKEYYIKRDTPVKIQLQKIKLANGRTIKRPTKVEGLVVPTVTGGRPDAPEPVAGYRVSKALFANKEEVLANPGGVRNIGDEDVHKGHIMALELGGPDIPENIVPQYAQFQSNGIWRKLETTIHDLAIEEEKNNNKVYFEANVQYRNNLLLRNANFDMIAFPTGFEVKVTVLRQDGSQESKTIHVMEQAQDHTDLKLSLRALYLAQYNENAKLLFDIFSKRGEGDELKKLASEVSVLKSAIYAEEENKLTEDYMEKYKEEDYMKVVDFFVKKNLPTKFKKALTQDKEYSKLSKALEKEQERMLKIISPRMQEHLKNVDTKFGAEFDVDPENELVYAVELQTKTIEQFGMIDPDGDFIPSNMKHFDEE